MRVSPISVSMYSHAVRNNKKNQNVNKNLTEMQQPNFKSWGSTGSVIGAFAGLGAGTLVSLATGGLFAPLFLSAAGCLTGAITGDTAEAKYKNKDKNDDDYYYYI